MPVLLLDLNELDLRLACYLAVDEKGLVDLSNQCRKEVERHIYLPHQTVAGCTNSWELVMMEFE